MHAYLYEEFLISMKSQRKYYKILIVTVKRLCFWNFIQFKEIKIINRFVYLYWYSQTTLSIFLFEDSAKLFLNPPPQQLSKTKDKKCLS